MLMMYLYVEQNVKIGHHLFKKNTSKIYISHSVKRCKSSILQLNNTNELDMDIIMRLHDQNAYYIYYTFVPRKSDDVLIPM